MAILLFFIFTILGVCVLIFGKGNGKQTCVLFFIAAVISLYFAQPIKNEYKSPSQMTNKEYQQFKDWDAQQEKKKWENEPAFKK